MSQGTRTDSPVGSMNGSDTAASYENSAHPPIHTLNKALTPDEFGLVFKANKAEVIVYKIIVDAEQTRDYNAVVRETTLTLYRKQPDGRRQVGVRFRGLSIGDESWLTEAPDHAEFFVAQGSEAEAALRSIAAGGEENLSFELHDDLAEVGGMPLVRFLHLMEAVKIGRPSTYAVTLRNVLDHKAFLAFEAKSGRVSLTPEGAAVGAMLETRCDDLTSIAFATTFDRKLNDVATGQSSAKDFLTWVLSLTHPGDPLADAAIAKLWNGLDDLRTENIPKREGFGAVGGYISDPSVHPNGAGS